MKSTKYNGIIASSKTRLRCLSCGVCFSKGTECVRQHINGTKHQDNKVIMFENGVSFSYPDDVLYCRPCKRDLDVEECITKHVECDDHVNWMKALEDLTDGEHIHLQAYLVSGKDQVFCGLCQVPVNCSLESIEDHMNNDIDHLTKLAESLEPLNGIFALETNDEKWCKICDSYIENTAKSIINHIDDDEQHTELLTKIEDLIEDHDVCIEDYLEDEDELNAYCYSCEVEVPCNVADIETHVSSEQHLANELE